MPVTRAAMAALCMFGLAACDDGGQGFVSASVRTPDKSGCGCTANALAHIMLGITLTTHERRANGVIDSPGRPSNGGPIETGFVQRKRRMVHESDKCKRRRHMRNEMGRPMHHDEQELLSVWEGWHLDDNRGGWLDPELCAKARQEEVKYIRRHRVPSEVCLRKTGKAPIKSGRGSQESPMCARGGLRRSTRSTRD